MFLDTSQNFMSILNFQQKDGNNAMPLSCRKSLVVVHGIVAHVLVAGQAAQRGVVEARLFGARLVNLCANLVQVQKQKRVTNETN